MPSPMVSGIVCYNLAILRRHHKSKDSAEGCDQEVNSQTGSISWYKDLIVGYPDMFFITFIQFPI